LPEALLDLGLTNVTPIGQILGAASIAKSSAVYGIWLDEDLSRGGDVFVQTSMVMRSAPNKKIGIGVTSPAIRNISTIARASAALREINSKRFRLGLGVEGLEDHAKLPLQVARPYRMLRETVDALRGIWSGEAVTMKGYHFDLDRHLARYRPGFTIPIYLGVREPILLRLAGRTADGVILSGPLRYLQKALMIVHEETTLRKLRARPRVVVWQPTLVTRNKADRDLAAKVAATKIAGTPSSVFEMANISDGEIQNVKRTRRERGYDDASAYVSEELLNSFTITGEPGEICTAFRSLGKLGADEIIFGPPYGREIFRSIRDVIEAWERL
jgi:alkanesulfonate monooxygenase SsuD/methylene tetrahydromethanopterin reductase-like flavin-dependent oxidoreductase (luciferase family)